MKTPHRFTAPAAIFAALAIPLLTNGCSSDITNPAGGLCCTDFKIGADLSGADFGVDASIKGQFLAFAQAAGDLTAVANASLDDVAGACKAIALAGGANADQEEATDAKAPNDRVTAWCNLAVAHIKAKITASGTLSVNVQAPHCEASVKASGDCQANCTVDASCQAKVKASPPKCTGGTLEVSCSGDCTASAGATMDCEGSCTVGCSGSCTANANVAVDCQGKCDGTCAAGGSANGTGVQADGSCNGTCSGTCTMKANATVNCSGTCKGGCNTKCSAQGSVQAKCSGTCSAQAQPLSCKGGKLEASVDCNVDANCQANCNASVQAKAECSPPSVDVTFTGSLDAEASATIEALRVNLPNIFLVFTTRGQAFVDAVTTVSGSAATIFDPGKLGVKGTACVAAIVPLLIQAGTNMSAAFSASGSVAGSVGGG